MEHNHDHHQHNHSHDHKSHEMNKEVKKHKGMDHHDHSHHNHEGMIDDFKKRFYISILLTIPILLLSEMIQHWFNFHLVYQGDRYVLFCSFFHCFLLWRLAFFERFMG